MKFENNIRILDMLVVCILPWACCTRHCRSVCLWVI